MGIDREKYGQSHLLEAFRSYWWATRMQACLELRHAPPSIAANRPGSESLIPREASLRVQYGQHEVSEKREGAVGTPGSEAEPGVSTPVRQVFPVLGVGMNPQTSSNDYERCVSASLGQGWTEMAVPPHYVGIGSFSVGVDPGWVAPAAVARVRMKCPDCKGSGTYTGLHTVEQCATCKGEKSI